MRTTVRNSYVPKTGEYCNTIIVDQDNGMQYIFDSDGVFTTYTSKQQEGAPMGYVNAKTLAAIETAENFAVAKDAEVLQAAKDYTDQHSGGVSKQYVDDQDAATLQLAKDYTDAHSGQGGVSQQYVDDQDTLTLGSAKSYTDTKIAALPTVNNATLDIQVNGSSAASFTANASSNVTANLTVPVFTLTDTDPGEGAALADNHFIAVYGIEESE